MRLRSGLNVIFAVAAAGALMAQGVWHSKSQLEWTPEDVERILHDSPWVARASAGFTTMGTSRAAADRRSIPVHRSVDELVRDPGREVQDSSAKQPLYYRIRLLTAKPVREALLRRISFLAIRPATGSESVIHVEEIKKELAAESERERLEKFISMNPDDIRSRGDAEHIVIAITTAMRIPRHQRDDTMGYAAQWLEQYRPAMLSNTALSSLSGHTFLSTRTGKRARLVQFEPPGADNLGAKFYFPRKLPDGSPFVTLEDKELRFHTEIEGKEIRVKFNLKKLAYKGKLEL